MNKMNNMSRIKKYPVVVLLIVTLVLGMEIVSNPTKTSSAKTVCKAKFSLLVGEKMNFKPNEDTVESIKTNKSGVVAVESEYDYTNGSRSIKSYSFTAIKPGKAVITLKTKYKSTSKLTVTVLKRNGIDVSVVDIIDRGYYSEESSFKIYSVLYKITNKEKVLLDTLWLPIDCDEDGDDDLIPGKIYVPYNTSDEICCDCLPPGSSTNEMMTFYSDHMPSKDEVKPKSEYEYWRTCYESSKNVSNKLKGSINGTEVAVKNTTNNRVSFNYDVSYLSSHDNSSLTYSGLSKVIEPKKTYYDNIGSRIDSVENSCKLVNLRGAALNYLNFSSFYNYGFSHGSDCEKIRYKSNPSSLNSNTNAAKARSGDIDVESVEATEVLLGSETSVKMERGDEKWFKLAIPDNRDQKIKIAIDVLPDCIIRLYNPIGIWMTNSNFGGSIGGVITDDPNVSKLQSEQVLFRGYTYYFCISYPSEYFAERTNEGYLRISGDYKPDNTAALNAVKGKKSIEINTTPGSTITVEWGITTEKRRELDDKYDTTYINRYLRNMKYKKKYVKKLTAKTDSGSLKIKLRRKLETGDVIHVYIKSDEYADLEFDQTI